MEIDSIKVRDMNIEKELMKVVKEFSEKSNKVSEARCHSGDSGNMFAFGYYNSKHGDYKSMQDEVMDIRNYSITARKILDKYFNREIQDICRSRSETGCSSIGINGWRRWN